MKKSFVTAVIAFIIGITAAIGYYAYQNKAWPFGKEALSGPQVTVAAEIQSYMNPMFDDVNDFMLYVIDVQQEVRIDSVLSSTPTAIIGQIAEICIRKYGGIDRALFWKEYSANYNNVYKYLSTSGPPLVDPTSAPVSQSTNLSVPTSPSVAIRNDTIASAAIVNQSTTTVTSSNNE